MRCEDLRPRIVNMTSDELMEHVEELRLLRALYSSPRGEKAAVKKSEKKVNAAMDLLDKLSPEERKALKL